MGTLRELRIGVGWTISKLASEANSTRRTIAKAEKGSAIRVVTAKRIAGALSKAHGYEIKITDIQSLNVL